MLTTSEVNLVSCKCLNTYEQECILCTQHWTSIATSSATLRHFSCSFLLRTFWSPTVNDTRLSLRYIALPFYCFVVFSFHHHRFRILYHLVIALQPYHFIPVAGFSNGKLVFTDFIVRCRYRWNTHTRTHLSKHKAKAQYRSFAKTNLQSAIICNEYPV